jgi:hypothetical protein
MRRRRNRLDHALVALGCFFLWVGVLPLSSAQAGKEPSPDVLGNLPPVTKPELLVHDQGDDLSASRLDCEVFGWNRAFTEVAAVGADTRRGPRGKHRGEAFLLVYALGQGLPIHNVIAHNITHPDLPHDPIPIDDARDLTWVIENSYLDMWPRRPKHKRPPQGMQVKLIWDPLQVKNGLCTPLVGFSLHWHGMSRFQQFMPVDMQVDCRNLRQTDSRVYWGKADVAAAMVRFDFPLREANERSARFVVSAAWRMARELNIVVIGQANVPPKLRRQVMQELRQLGAVHFGGANGSSDDPGASQGPVGVERPQSGSRPGVVSIRSKEQYIDLGRYLGRTFFAGSIGKLEGDLTEVINGFPDLVVTLGWVSPEKNSGSHGSGTAGPSGRDGDAGAGPPSAPDGGTDSEQHYLPAPMPMDAAPDSKPARPLPPPRPEYLDNWDSES